ncbi:AMP-binding protein [Mechercharimyces sp. CAU 1602]|nr:AMP-binding protein [Mechercharimyces sp. CAU 1602]
MNKEKKWLASYPAEVPAELDIPDVPLTRFLEDAVRDFPDREVIHFMGKRMTYSQLQDHVYRLANALRGLGIKKGDRISLMLPNSPQAVIAYYASLYLGAVVVQTNPLYMERELEHQLNDSEAETIICLDLVYPKVANVKAQTKLKQVIVTSIKDYLPFPKNVAYPLKVKFVDKIKVNIPYEDKNIYRFSDLIKKALADPVESAVESPEELALLQYTGGTTGLAKGAMLTHRNLATNAAQCAAWVYKTERGKEKVLGLLPFFHVYGMTTVMNYSIYMASTMILIPKFDADQLLKTFAKEKPTMFPGAPTMYVALINHPKAAMHDLSSVDACISGSAPLPVDVQKTFEELTGGNLVEGYGLTEASPVTHCNIVWGERTPGSIGLPWPNTDCRIVNPETGEEVAAGEIGEMQVKGPQVMTGYWNRPEETAKVLKDGWLSTGDMARMDEKGAFYIMDRKKDMIIASGYNIYPREVEEVLYTHEAIQEAAVVGVQHAYRGETVKAYVVLKEGATLSEEELDQFCRGQMAKYKVPRLYEFRTDLPKSSVGKILRRELVREEKEKLEREAVTQ